MSFTEAVFKVSAFLSKYVSVTKHSKLQLCGNNIWARALCFAGRVRRATARAWLQCAHDSQVRIISWKVRRQRALANAVAKFIKTLHEGINFDPAGLET